MTRKRAIAMTLGAALLLPLTGCDYVASKQPVGKTPLALEEAEWAGVWMNGNGPVTVRVVDAAAGRLEVAWIEEKEDELVLESIEVYLRRHQEWTFASFAGVEEGEKDLLWSRLERNGRQVILWWPKAAEFKRLVESGVLPGTIDGDDVLLEPLDAEQLSVLLSEEHGMLYQWDEPMTFWRLR